METCPSKGNTEGREEIYIFFTWEQKSQLWRAIDFPPPCSCCFRHLSSFYWDQKSILDHPFNIKSGRCLYTQQTQFTLRFWSLSQQHQWPTSKNCCFSFNTAAKRFRIFMSIWEIQQNVIFSNSPSGSSVFILITSGMKIIYVISCCSDTREIKYYSNLSLCTRSVHRCTKHAPIIQ